MKWKRVSSMMGKSIGHVTVHHSMLDSTRLDSRSVKEECADAGIYDITKQIARRRRHVCIE